MTTYKLSPFKEMIIRDDGTWIPVNEANTDYQAYLKWVAEGNLPYPSDFVEPLPTASVTPLPAETN